MAISFAAVLDVLPASDCPRYTQKYLFPSRACLKIKNCTKHVFLSPFHDRIKKKGAFICQDVMN